MPSNKKPREDQALLLCRRLPLVPNKASSDAGRRTAKRWPCALVRTKAWCAPLKRGLGGLRQAGPGICNSKYVEDAKAARSVRV